VILQAVVVAILPLIHARHPFEIRQQIEFHDRSFQRMPTVSALRIPKTFPAKPFGQISKFRYPIASMMIEQPSALRSFAPRPDHHLIALRHRTASQEKKGDIMSDLTGRLAAFENLKKVGLLLGVGLISSVPVFVIVSYAIKLNGSTAVAGIDANKIGGAVLIASVVTVGLSFLGFRHCLQQRKWDVTDPRVPVQIQRALFIILTLAEAPAIAGLVGFLLTDNLNLVIIPSAVALAVSVFHIIRWPKVIERFKKELQMMGAE
jgi:hypothetical protein